MMAKRGWSPQRGRAKRKRFWYRSIHAWAAVGLLLMAASFAFMLHTYLNFSSPSSPWDRKKRQSTLPPPTPGQAQFRTSLLHKVERDMAPYGRILRVGILASAAELSPWTMTVQFQPDRTVWIAPPALGAPRFNTPEALESQANHLAATLASLALMMGHADSVPSVTAVFHQGGNCLHTRADSRMLLQPPRSLQNHTWGKWVSSGTKAPPPARGPGSGQQQGMTRHGPAAYRAPVLMSQGTQWQGTSMTCFGLPFPSYDWVWATKDFTDGSQDRLDGLEQVPWPDRMPTLVFRGTGWSTDSIPYPGIQEGRALRLRAARLALSLPDMMDIKLTGCGEESCDPELMGRPLTWREQLEYKFQLDVDGRGSSHRTQHLLISGSLVFKVDSPVAQFWFADLQPWVHYIPVSWHDLESDLPLKLTWAIRHDRDAERIMLNGRRWVLEHLNNQNVAWYQSTVLTQLAKQQAEHFSLIPGAVRFCCNHLEAASSSSGTGSGGSSNMSHYVNTCKQHAPHSMRHCSPSRNAFNLALYGSVNTRLIRKPRGAGHAPAT